MPVYEGLIAETVNFAGDGGDVINAYLARPLDPGPYPGVIVVHHMPGWDEATKEIVAVEVTISSVHDSLMLSPLLGQVPGRVHQVSGDGAYDTRACYEAACAWRIPNQAAIGV